MQALLARGCGSAEEHTILLCNLLLGFGHDVYVAYGADGDGSHSWIIELQKQAGGSAKVVFWDELNATRIKADHPRV